MHAHSFASATVDIWQRHHPGHGIGRANQHSPTNRSGPRNRKGTAIYGRKTLLPALILSGIQSVYAYPKTYELANETDAVCVVADYDVEPAIRFGSDSLGWDFAETDTVYQSTDEGITQYRMVYNHNFITELGRVDGIGKLQRTFVLRRITDGLAQMRRSHAPPDRRRERAAWK